MDFIFNVVSFLCNSIINRIVSVMNSIVILILPKRWKFIQRAWQLPGLQPHHPFFGNLWSFITNKDNIGKYLANAYRSNRREGFFLVWVFYYPVIFFNSWQHTKRIIGSERFLDRGWPLRKTTSGTDGLVTMAHGEWNKRKELVEEFYKPRNIQNLIPLIKQKADQIVAGLSTRGLVQIMGTESVVSKEIFAMTLSSSFGTVSVENEAEIGLMIAGPEFLRILTREFFKISHWISRIQQSINWLRGLRDTRKQLRDLAAKMIKFRVAERWASSSPRVSKIGLSNRSIMAGQALLDVMLDEFMQCGILTEESLDQLVGELLTTVAVGYQAMKDSILWVLHDMAHNQSVERKLYNEIKNFEDKKKQISIKDLDELTYLDQCIKESLRIHPPVAMVSRTVDEDVEIDGHIIPEGILSLTSVYSIHHDEHIYPNPKKFDPSRFEAQNFAKIPQGAYIPFGYGPRRCIGELLAIVQIKIIVIAIVKKFIIQAVDTDQNEPQIDFLTRPNGQLRLKFLPRQNIDLKMPSSKLFKF